MLAARTCPSAIPKGINLFINLWLPHHTVGAAQIQRGKEVPLHLTLHNVGSDGALCTSLSIMLGQALPLLQEQFPALEQARDDSRA